MHYVNDNYFTHFVKLIDMYMNKTYPEKVAQTYVHMCVHTYIRMRAQSAIPVFYKLLTYAFNNIRLLLFKKLTSVSER